ncbi:MAG: YceI family protein [Oceanicaulis sp.]
MRRLLLAAALTAICAAPAIAQDWALDRAASSVEFEASAFNTPLTGAFEQFSAEIRLDPADLAGARIDASVDTSSFALSNSQYRSNLAGGDGLAVEAHPQARFVSQDIRAVEGGYEAVGELSIKGETQPLTLPFTLEIDGDRAVANAAFTIERASFGVGGGSWSDVGPDVTVTLHIEADRAG